MTEHVRMVIAFRGGPRDGSRKDLGDSTGGTWPAEYAVGRWPLTNDWVASSGAPGGRYVRSDQWSAKAEARIYVWNPEPRTEDH